MQLTTPVSSPLSPHSLFPSGMSSRLATTSTMSLVQSLMSLVNEMTALGERVHSHRRTCQHLIRRAKMLTPLFEEIKEVMSPLPGEAVVAFQDMRAVLAMAKGIIKDCASRSRLWMVRGQLGRLLASCSLGWGLREWVVREVYIVHLSLGVFRMLICVVASPSADRCLRGKPWPREWPPSMVTWAEPLPDSPWS